MLPVAFYIFLSGQNIHNSYKNYVDAEALLKSAFIVEQASSVVHELQKERGRSAAYLSGGSKEKLLTQRESANVVIQKSMLTLTSNKSAQNLLFSKLNNLNEFRNKVDSKNIPKEIIIKKYSNIIKELLHINIFLSKETSNINAATTLKSIRILEEAKESGGLFRATISSAFVTNKALSNKDLQKIINLKAGLVKNILSHGLSLSSNSKEKVLSLQESLEWKKMNHEFLNLIKLSQKGEYGIDGNNFFATMTKILDKINLIIKVERTILVDSLEKERSMLKSTMIWSIIISLVFISFMIIYLSKTIVSMRSSLNSLVENIFSAASTLSEHAKNLSHVSNEINQQSNIQSSGIQNTASASDEISAMANRNQETTSTGLNITNSAIKIAKETSLAVEEILNSIKNVEDNNQVTINFLSDTNNNVSKIQSMINEIDGSTKSINDIVFQTKLLSFNASVEAARAGEHGKGFAVVADEVGNLASMSGKSALNICQILEESVENVDSLKKKTNDITKEIKVTSNKTIQESQDIVKKCRLFTDELLSKINSLAEKMNSIESASQEQTLGLKEISQSITLIDDSAKMTLNKTQDLAYASNSVSKEVFELEKVAKNLKDYIKGSQRKD